MTSYPIAQQQEVTPTPEQWQTFWKRVEPLRLAYWRPTYYSRDLGTPVCDGTQWFLQYSVRERGRTSSGDNAYPVISKPKVATLEGDSFDQLTAAFDALFPCTLTEFAKKQ